MGKLLDSKRYIFMVNYTPLGRMVNCTRFYGYYCCKFYNDILIFTFLMGLLWGVGGLSYGLGIRYLGMSLGNSVVLGFCAAFGALVPSIYYNLNPT